MTCFEARATFARHESVVLRERFTQAAITCSVAGKGREYGSVSSVLAASFAVRIGEPGPGDILKASIHLKASRRRRVSQGKQSPHNVQAEA